ncbi:hypothetical protein tpqmel_0875, partial [Candidatus Gastranaerophilus sp. (ex Termes propinquus)]
MTHWDLVLEDAKVALELQDETLLEETFQSLLGLEKELDTFELQRMLNGEYDDYDAILTVNAGAGGTDAQDWASMLLRMYMRWAASKGYGVELLDKT